MSRINRVIAERMDPGWEAAAGPRGQRRRRRLCAARQKQPSANKIAWVGL